MSAWGEEGVRVVRGALVHNNYHIFMMMTKPKGRHFCFLMLLLVFFPVFLSLDIIIIVFLIP